MKLQLIAVQIKIPDWVHAGFADYLKCFLKDPPFELTEIATSKHGKNTNIVRILEEEGKLILTSVVKGNRIIALDIPGVHRGVMQLARQLERWKHD